MLYKNIEKIDAKILKALIINSSDRHEKVKKLYERYKGSDKGVPILNRVYMIDTVKQSNKINNKLANDFFSEIINMKVGFFCGVPIVYELDKSNYMQEVEETETTSTDTEIETETTKTEMPKEEVSTKYDVDMEYIKTWAKINQIADIDLETSKRTSICGYCGRLFYMDKHEDKAVIKIKLIDPWELIFIGDSIEEAEYSIRYYSIRKWKEDGTSYYEDWAEVYSASGIEKYKKKDVKTTKDTTNEESKYELQGKETHAFKVNPLIGFSNNDEMLGDCERVITLIDGYDRTISDVDSELEQLRLAYLKFINCSISSEEIEKARQTGAFSIPGENADVDFITKNLSDEIIEHHLDRIERNIYRFSATPNMNDVSFSGNVTGVAMKYKFRSFEDKCKVAELKFEKASNQQFKLLTDVWNGQGASIDYLDIDLQFTRNYPQNLVEEVQMLRDSKGIISEPTRFSLVSFIENPEDEIRKLEEEEQENLDNFVERNERLKTNDNTENKNAFSNTAKEEDK